jgi:hypothetical protein
MAKKNIFLNIGKKLLLVALPIILKKGGEIVTEWVDKKGNEDKNKKLK